MDSLEKRFPPSPSCQCDICRSFCIRPGWWTVEEAEWAVKRGYSMQIMLELSPQLDIGVLSPAFWGCGGGIAVRELASMGCSFYINQQCELYHTGLVPLECRFCHHDRQGLGIECHQALVEDWSTPQGQKLVYRWCNITGQYRLLALLKQRGFRAW